MNSNNEQAIKSIEQAKRILVLSHFNPDGDALGSGLALLNFFINMGKEVDLMLPNPFPSFLSWMPKADQAIIFSETPELGQAKLEEADLIFLVDFNTWSRLENLGDIVRSNNANKILIDHHPNPDIKASVIYSDTSVSSTAELIYLFIEETGFLSFMDKNIATCIFTGIMTDTGNFSHNSSQAITFEIVAHLLKFEIDKDAIHAKIYHDFSANRIQLLGFALKDRMKIFPELHTAYIYLSQKDLDKYYHQVGDTEGFVNIPFSISGIVFSVLFIEKDDHIKLSLRSKGTFSVNNFSGKHFNGGGHDNAAGGKSFSNLQEAIRSFEQVLPLYKSQLKASFTKVQLNS